MSLKAWMCGGRVDLVPCAVAGHMFKGHTYAMSTKGKGGARFNTDRIAEVWLDDYKKYYYREGERGLKFDFLFY
jgi:polypeptide N-acetylgalactosaminyltransferase